MQIKFDGPKIYLDISEAEGMGWTLKHLKREPIKRFNGKWAKFVGIAPGSLQFEFRVFQESTGRVGEITARIIEDKAGETGETNKV